MSPARMLGFTLFLLAACEGEKAPPAERDDEVPEDDEGAAAERDEGEEPTPRDAGRRDASSAAPQQRDAAPRDASARDAAEPAPKDASVPDDAGAPMPMMPLM
ncbi:MAG: hypothetical protein ABW352_24395, partial [Polyangiales bacterium]